jgi:hypothetical protein
LPNKLTVLRARLLRSIVNEPALPTLLTRITPKALARLVDHVGLNDSAEIMSLAPIPTLLRALDESVWKSPCPGATQGFDHAEFIRWLEVWNAVGDEFVAERLGAIGDEYLEMCFSSVLQVDSGFRSGFAGETADFDIDRDETDVTGYQGDSKNDCYEIYGHYLIRPAFEDDWETIRTALDALWRHAPDRLLHMLSALSTPESMLDSDRRRVSLNLDVEYARERYRERRGYVSAMGARAFLATATALTTQKLLAMSTYDTETQRFLASMGSENSDSNPVENPSHVDAADDELTPVSGDANRSKLASPPESAVRALSLLFEQAQIVEPPRLQLPFFGTDDHKQPALAELLGRLEANSQEAYQQRGRELAYLSTVLMAGATVEAMPFTGRDARDAAFAICNLGLEFLWSKRIVEQLDTEPGLIRPFLLGWQMLNNMRDRVVEAFTASYSKPEIAVRLARSPWLRQEVAIGMRDLQNAVAQRQFGDARDAVIFLSIIFDATACRAIASLFDDLPHLAMFLEGSENNKKIRWIESLADLSRIASSLSQL